MTIIYESMAPIIPNTIMRKQYMDGVFRTYRIKPAEGYVMHDVGYDSFREVSVLDENGNQVYDEGGIPIIEEVPFLGYRTAEASVGYNYDFTPAEMQDDNGSIITVYGSRQFFCKPIDEVPADQIFGVATSQQPEII